MFDSGRMTGIQLPAAILISLRELRARDWGLQGGLTEVGEWPTISFLLLASYLKKADVYQNQQPVPSSVINDIVKITLKENF